MLASSPLRNGVPPNPPMPRRITLLSFLFLVAIRLATNAAAVPPPPLPTLTTVAQIRALSTEEATRGYPVHLHALIIFHNTRRYCFAEDDTGAIYLMRQRETFDLAAGQRVELFGITERGLYAPEVLEQRVNILGTDPLPPPQEATVAELAARKYHCQRVAVEGIVRAADWRWNGGHRLDLQLETAGGRLDAQIYDTPNDRSYDDLLDARIRLVGIASGKFNERHELIRPIIEAEEMASISVISPGPADLFDLPIQPASKLLQFSTMPLQGRIRVQGTVTYQQPGQALYLRDATGGLLVKTQVAEPFAPGAIVDAAGLPVMGTYAPVLQQAICRPAGHGPESRPRRITSADALNGRFDADLVTIEAVLVNTMARKDEYVLVLEAGGVTFEGRLALPPSQLQDPNSERTIDLHLPTPRPITAAELPAHGSVLNVTGICAVREVLEAGVVLAPRSFQILLRSPADITFLHGPPFWTPRRMAWVLGLMALAILGAIFWNAALRHRVRQQTEIIRRRIHHEAVMQERQRMAREVHDTLIQGFAGISLQLEAVRGKLPAEATVLNRHLEVAHVLARESMAEARKSIWAWHNDALVSAGLAAALAASARSIAGGAGVETRLETAGDFSHLSAEVENNLLYIGREALMNAVKHAAPRLIVLSLECAGDQCRLSIRDDGRGFDAASTRSEAGSDLSGFGLISMRERAQQIGAEFVIQSEPGHGATIAVVSPLQPPNPSP